MGEKLEILALGGLTIRLNGVPLTGFASRKMELLIVYLAYHRRVFSREFLAGLLWPDHRADQALANLRVMLFRLGKQLSPFLTVHRQTVSLDAASHVWMDALEVETALRLMTTQSDAPNAAYLPSKLAKLEHAVQLYRGDFVVDLSASDAPELEDWVLAEREYLRVGVLDALERLANLYHQEEVYGQAIQYARQAVQIDPLRESSHRLLMTLYHLTGEQQAALAQYEICRRRLREDLNIEPDPTTEDLYQRISRAVPLTRSANNLPPAATPFIGREQELRALNDLLDDPACRLITLHGLGGMGKTRLAIQAASDRQYRDGIYFISLEEIDSPELLVYAISRIFSLRNLETLDQLKNFLRRKEMLLILDNFEHILDAAAQVSEIIANAPSVKIMVTSREPLDLREEWLFEVGGLPYPPLGDATTISPDKFPAVQLFQQIARKSGIRTDWNRDRESIIQLCHYAEGMPLGVELAASAIRQSSYTQIINQLQQDLGVLQTRVRNVPDRHRSVESLLEYSWQRLDDTERRVLAQLSVFRGGIPELAALKICAAPLPLLEKLVQKSLLRPLGANRYIMHALMHQFAAGKLGADPTALAEVRSRHATYFETFLVVREPQLMDTRQKQARAEIAQDLDNIRLAWDWWTSQIDAEAMARTVYPLQVFFTSRGGVSQGASMFQQGLDVLENQADVSQSALARVMTALGLLLVRLGQWEKVRTLFEQALPICERNTLPSIAARCLTGLAYDMAFIQLKLDDGRALAEQALQYYMDANDDVGVAAVRITLGSIAIFKEDFEEAVQEFEASIKVAERLDLPLPLSQAYFSLSHCAYRSLKYKEAMQLAEHAIEIQQANDLKPEEGASLIAFGNSAIDLGFHLEAEHAYQRSLAIYREMDNPYGIGNAYEGLGNVALNKKEYDEAERYYQRAMEAYQIARNHLGRASIQCNLGYLALCRQGDIGEAQTAFDLGIASLQEVGSLQSRVGAELLRWGAKCVEMGYSAEAKAALLRLVHLAMDNKQMMPSGLSALLLFAGDLAAHGNRDLAVRYYQIVMLHPDSRENDRLEAKNTLVGIGAVLPEHAPTFAELVRELDSC